MADDGACRPVFAITVTGVVIDKAANNPVISGTPAGYSADFRDPYFFRSGNEAYCIVGTSRDGVASTSLHQYNASTGVFDYTGRPFYTGAGLLPYVSFRHPLPLPASVSLPTAIRSFRQHVHGR